LRRLALALAASLLVTATAQGRQIRLCAAASLRAASGRSAKGPAVVTGPVHPGYPALDWTRRMELPDGSRKAASMP
jgi:hypothetical protein